MDYGKLSQILKDIVGFIKSFAAEMKAFIDGFKTNYEVAEPTKPAEEE